MKLNELRDLIVALDASYERIESEYGDAGDAAPWSSFFYRGPAEGESTTSAADACDDHDGASHAIGGDPLSRAFAQELSGWVRLAGRSDTARSLLGIERIDDAFVASDRLGALSSVLPSGAPDDVDLRLATTRDLARVADRGRDLWERTPRSDFNLWTNADGVRPSRASDRYAAWLARAGEDARLAAPALIGDCPPAKLLGAVVDGGVARHTPLAYAETWLDDARIARGDRLWSTPCPACEVGMRDWACGHDELVARLTPEDKARYAAASDAFQAFLRGEGSRIRREVRPSDARSIDRAAPTRPSASVPRVAEARAVATEAPHTPKDAEARAHEGSAPLPARGPGAPSAALPARGPGAPSGSLVDLPVRPELRDRFSEAAVAATTGPRASAKASGSGGGDRRESVHVRLEIPGVDASSIEIREIRGREAISQLFEFDLLVVCPADVELSVDGTLGADVAIVFQRGDVDVRRVHGMIAELVDRQESESEWRSYRLHVVPRAWRSTLVRTQEVYLDTNVPDLILKKLALVGIEEVEMRLRQTYPVRELVVQYKETDQAFVSRLAEHLGIAFFFEHGDGVDKLVFSDDNAGFRPLDVGEIPFRRRGDRKDIFEFETRARAFPARYAEQDYNYRTPTVDLTSIHDEPVGFGGGSVEYGAHFRTPEEGATFARIRAEEQVVSNRYGVGRSDVAELAPGGTFTMSGHPRLDGASLLVVEVEHHAVQATKLQSGSDEPYTNRFRTVDAAATYRPPRSTPRPRVSGVLTAVVEPDPSGVVAESAVLDEEGRYTVLFYFDAADVAGRAKHSRPVRMIQAHAGPNYGIHFPLKPGVEVLIVFMDGDPDRPLILGSVPNPITPSPVNATVNLMNRIETTSGLIIEMRDAVPPLAK